MAIFVAWHPRFRWRLDLNSQPHQCPLHLDHCHRSTLTVGEQSASQSFGLRAPQPDATCRNAAAAAMPSETTSRSSEGCKVLVTERDFHDVTRAYLNRAREDGVIRAELFIGPQSFTERGTTIEELMSGVLGAIEEAVGEHGMSVGLMISVHRHPLR